MFDTRTWSASTKTVVLIVGFAVIFLVTTKGSSIGFLRERTPSTRQVVWASWFAAVMSGLAAVALGVLAIRGFIAGDSSGALAELAVAALALGGSVVGFRLMRRFADPRRKLAAHLIASLPQEKVSGRTDRTFAYDAQVTLDTGQVVDDVRIVAGRIMRVGGRAMLPFGAERVVDVRIKKVRTPEG